LENVNADQTRELVTVKTQLSAVEKDQTEAIDDLKKTDVLVSESLQGELVRLREKYNFAISERDAHKSQLVEALLEKDRLRKGSEEGKDLDAKDSDGPEISSKGAEKIEKLRERLKERNEVSGHYQKRGRPQISRVYELQYYFINFASLPQESPRECLWAERETLRSPRPSGSWRPSPRKDKPSVTPTRFHVLTKCLLSATRKV
jgi:hypothetical protein